MCHPVARQKAIQRYVQFTDKTDTILRCYKLFTSSLPDS